MRVLIIILRNLKVSGSCWKVLAHLQAGGGGFVDLPLGWMSAVVCANDARLPGGLLGETGKPGGEALVWILSFARANNMTRYNTL